MIHPNLNGEWTYRSLLNNSEEVGNDPAKALALIFGEGKLSLTATTNRLVIGVLDFGQGAAMDLNGDFLSGVGVSPDLLIITGTGRAGTITDKWVYQYKGFVVSPWAEGVKQVPAILGTVIRTIPHGNGAAGVVASFMMLKRD
jgi:hypothetical protein